MKETQNISIAVDALVFRYLRASGVSVLFIRRKNPPFKGKWSIPGGFMDPEEPLEVAVERELYGETGIRMDYLEQLYTFGKPSRDPRSRVISVAYLGVVNGTQSQNIRAKSDAQQVEWFNIQSLPFLAFDHRIIVNMAIERLKLNIIYQPIAFEFLEKQFAFYDLEHLYEILLNQPVDRRNFKKKVLSLGVLDELDDKMRPAGAGRPGNIYQFNKNTYRRLIMEGVVFEL